MIRDYSQFDGYNTSRSSQPGDIRETSPFCLFNWFSRPNGLLKSSQNGNNWNYRKLSKIRARWWNDANQCSLSAFHPFRVPCDQFSSLHPTMLLIPCSLLLVPFTLAASIPALHPSVTYRSSVPDHARKLSGSDLTTYVNNNQKLWKAETSRITSTERKVSETLEYRILIVIFCLQARVKDIKFIKSNEDIESSEQIFASIPTSYDARDHWPQCTQIGAVRDQSDCGEIL